MIKLRDVQRIAGVEFIELPGFKQTSTMDDLDAKFDETGGDFAGYKFEKQARQLLLNDDKALVIEFNQSTSKRQISSEQVKLLNPSRSMFDEVYTEDEIYNECY